MLYQLTVFFNGKHLFATKMYLICDDETLREVCWIIKEVLTEAKGYTILVIKWELIGIFLDF